MLYLLFGVLFIDSSEFGRYALEILLIGCSRNQLEALREKTGGGIETPGNEILWD